MTLQSVPSPSWLASKQSRLQLDNVIPILVPPVRTPAHTPYSNNQDARLLIQGEFPTAPAEEGGVEGAVAAAAPTARSTKRSRALIYTGDLGRSVRCNLHHHPGVSLSGFIRISPTQTVNFGGCEPHRPTLLWELVGVRNVKPNFQKFKVLS